MSQVPFCHAAVRVKVGSSIQAARDGTTVEFTRAPVFGFCASQNIYYFSHKLHAVCGVKGVIHSYDLSKASVHDLNYMKDVKLAYHICSIYCDKGYI